VPSAFPDEVRSGFVSLVGRPNSGKSTLLNAAVGTKVAITSDTPQTTRHRLRAVIDRDDAQLVLVDTPGLHKPHDALGEELNRSALMALDDVDVVCFVLDASAPFGTGDEWVLKHVSEVPSPKVLVITKADLVAPEEAERQVERASSHAEFADVVVVSAVEEFNVEGFVQACAALLPMGPRYFPQDMATDQPIEVMVAEFIREKVLVHTHEEVPHAVGVAVEDMEEAERTGLVSVWATVYVERDSQKGIIVGKNGSMIKLIGTEARVDLERLLGSQVFLDLRVKVRKNWRRDASQIQRFGYGEGL
jgi:GTP-binding protein Era